MQPGNPGEASTLKRTRQAGAPLRAAIALAADEHAAGLRDVLEDIRSAGHTSLGTIADELNRRGILTRRGGRWHKSTVINLLSRLQRLAA